MVAPSRTRETYPMSGVLNMGVSSNVVHGGEFDLDSPREHSNNWLEPLRASMKLIVGKLDALLFWE